MNRKIFTIICTAMMVLGLSACAQNKENKEMKTLVAYFSASGVTESVAKQLAEVANADLLEIKPAQPYTDADLDWTNKQSRSTIEMNDKSSRPAITDKLANLDGYSTIYVGFPIWWYTAPTIINTFLESYDFKDKTVILFATSGGSNITKSISDLQTTYPNIKIKGGQLLNHPSKKQLEDFINGNK
ncbi:MAG: flavodoxin [Bacteroidales bacterium]|nr:flavodoxin [Bacteroidales bacterium]